MSPKGADRSAFNAAWPEYEKQYTTWQIAISEHWRIREGTTYSNNVFEGQLCEPICILMSASAIEFEFVLLEKAHASFPKVEGVGLGSLKVL